MSTTGTEKKGFKMTLTRQIMIATVVGLVAGIVVGPAIAPVKVVGDIFLRLILMALPVFIMGLVTESVGSIKPKDLGRMGVKVLTLFVMTTSIAAVIGVALAFIIQPGAGMPAMELTQEAVATDTPLSQIILNFFPSNIIASLSSGNLVQVIFFAIFLGMASAIHVEKTGDTRFIDLVHSTNKTIRTIIEMVMKVAPYGVAALLANVAGTMGAAVIIPLLKYLVALTIGTVLVIVIMLLITSTYCKVSPVKLAGKMFDMAAIAFTTTSSAMALPIKMKDAENKMGVSKRISRIVNPLGTVFNSDGQTLFLALAIVMISQFFNLDLSFGRLLTIIVLTTLASLGTPGVPGGGLVVFAAMTVTLGLPLEGIALIAGVDWFRGAIVTVANVTDDAMVSMMIAKSEGEWSREIFNGNVELDEDGEVIESERHRIFGTPEAEGAQ